MNEEVKDYEVTKPIELPKEKENTEETLKPEKNPKEKNKFKFTSIFKIIGKMPKIVKQILGVALLVLIFLLGISFDAIIEGQTKTTKLGFEDVGKLVTQTAHLTIVKDTKVNREFFQLFEIPFTESRQIFSYDVDVDAAVDFKQISYKEKKDKVIVSLPHAEIYKATLDTESLVVYLDMESLFSRIDLQKNNEALNEMKKQAIADAEANGIIEKADKNAQVLIKNMFKSNKKYADYEIEFKYTGGK